MPATPFKLTYTPEFDGLRGLAIIAVMFFHAGITKAGFIGVDIFFVLSGFLITSLLIAEFDTLGSVSISNFYFRRVTRLGPALLIMLVVFCLVSFFVLSKEEAYRNYIDALISLFYLSNWANAFSLHAPQFLAHTWSLSMEEQFYFLWPLILLFLLRYTQNRNTIALASFAIALSAWALRATLFANEVTPMRLYNGLDTRADALMVGCTLGVVLSSGLLNDKVTQLLQRLLGIGAPLALGLLFILSIFTQWDYPWMYYWGFFIIELLSAILILDIMINPASHLKTLLRQKYLVWVGTVSYGVYLWHYPIYRTLEAMGYHSLTKITWGTLLTFLIATFSYTMIEKPIVKLNKQRQTRNRAM